MFLEYSKYYKPINDRCGKAFLKKKNNIHLEYNIGLMSHKDSL